MIEPEVSNVLWLKLEDRLAENGFNVTEHGFSAWLAGKYNNGYYTNNINNYLSGAEVILNKNSFAFDFYLKPDFNVTNGLPSDGASHGIIQWFAGNFDKISLTVWNNAERMTLYIFCSNGGNAFIVASNNTVNWSAGDLVYFCVAVDRNGIGATNNRIRIYIGINGSTPTLIESLDTNINNELNNGTLFIGKDSFANKADSVIDNFKWENNCTEALITAMLNNSVNEGWLISYKIPNQFNRVSGLNVGRPL